MHLLSNRDLMSGDGIGSNIPTIEPYVIVMPTVEHIPTTIMPTVESTVSSRPLYTPVAHLETQISRMHILDI